MAKKKKKLGFVLGAIFVLALSIQVMFKAGDFAPFIYQLIFKRGQIDLRQSEAGRVNILLLGKGGAFHEGPNLTDTVMLVSLDIRSQKIRLVSLPRDLWLDDLKGKLNSAYAFGEAKQRGGGIKLARLAVEKTTNQKVDYVVALDFSGFVRAIDLVGGIDVDVERSFDDYEYPIEGRENDTCGFEGEDFLKRATASADRQLEAFPCRYEHISFQKGINHMDGETALKFVRSRHAGGEEGTDFARSKRQEKVLNAFRDKVFSLKIIFNPAKAISLYGTLGASIDTDIKREELDDFVKLAQRFQKAEIRSIVVDYGESNRGEGLLISPSITEEYNYQWVLIPRSGKNRFEEIYEFIRCHLTQDECIVSEIS